MTDRNLSPLGLSTRAADSPRWCATCHAYGEHHTDRHPVALGQFARVLDEVCDSCAEYAPGSTGDDVMCPETKRECGHHCNHSWSHDECHWCGKTWGEQPTDAEYDERDGHA